MNDALEPAIRAIEEYLTGALALLPTLGVATSSLF